MLSLSLDRDSYSPGDEIVATIGISLSKPTKARGVFVRLWCFERKIVKVDKVIDKYDLDRAAELGVPYSGTVKWHDEERDYVSFDQEKKIAGQGLFLEGVYEARFRLPQNASPTSREFGHDSKTTVWKISAKLDIPLAPDKSDEKEIVVQGLV